VSCSTLVVSDVHGNLARETHLLYFVEIRRGHYGPVAFRILGVDYFAIMFLKHRLGMIRLFGSPDEPVRAPGL
jgi:hypothetical protein